MAKNKTKLLDKIFGIQKYVCTSTSEGVNDTVWPYVFCVRALEARARERGRGKNTYGVKGQVFVH